MPWQDLFPFSVLFFLGSSTILKGFRGMWYVQLEKPEQCLEAITACLELRGFLGCRTLVLTPEKSCAKAGQVGPPTSFQASQHLVQVQRRNSRW